MSVSIRSPGQVQASRGALRAGWAALLLVLGWPARVYRARQLKDIGLVRQDLRDVTGLASGIDPSATLRARAEARRRR